MQSFLAAIPLAHTPVAIIGDGSEAEAKARLFAGSPAEVWRFGEGLTPDAAFVPGVRIVSRWPEPEDLGRFKLVFIAHDDTIAVDTWAEAARANGAWVNVVDQPSKCDFTTPAFVDRDGLVIGVATGGRSPALAQHVRDLIAATVPPDFAELVAHLEALRPAMFAALPDPAARKAFWTSAIRDALAIG
jgi:uroporphyrin-III C-methyltransferase / precorrin-2 dehydrogenase / sirohydrochlorin ferrochelatase